MKPPKKKKKAIPKAMELRYLNRNRHLTKSIVVIGTPEN